MFLAAMRLFGASHRTLEWQICAAPAPAVHFRRYYGWRDALIEAVRNGAPLAAPRGW
jgi:hypothetical protein